MNVKRKKKKKSLERKKNKNLMENKYEAISYTGTEVNVPQRD